MSKRLIEIELVARLADIVDIQPVNNSRPQSYPKACYTLIGDADNNCMNYDVATLTRELFQIDVFSPNSKEAKSVMLDIQESLLTWDDEISVTVSEDGLKQDEQDGLYRYSKDFYFTYTNVNLDFPESENGLLWLSHQHNVYTDTAGTVTAVDGDAVAHWKSIEGWGTNAAVQETVGARPAKHALGITPDGSNDWMLFDDLSFAGDYTFYVAGDG